MTPITTSNSIIVKPAFDSTTYLFRPAPFGSNDDLDVFEGIEMPDKHKITRSNEATLGSTAAGARRPSYTRVTCRNGRDGAGAFGLYKRPRAASSDGECSKAV